MAQPSLGKDILLDPAQPAGTGVAAGDQVVQGADPLLLLGGALSLRTSWQEAGGWAEAGGGNSGTGPEALPASQPQAHSSPTALPQWWRRVLEAWPL